ncbi:MAG: hypothetical protein ACYS5F_11040 [Planctomycetota bacterium]|jgi:hypothetical protein
MVWQAVRKKSEVKRSAKKKIVPLHTPDEEKSGETKSMENSEKEVVMEKNKDLNSGMELLEMDFLLGIVEHTASSDSKDVTMRRLNFDELLVYAVNAGDPYGKEIQCEATKELSRRTAKVGDNGD